MSDPGDPVGDGGQAMRVRGAQGALALAARRAARAPRRRFRPTVGRWLPRRSSIARTSAWRPLLLRWARTAAALRGGGAGPAPASAAAPVSWFNWHFHFTAVPGPGAVRGAAGTTGPAQAHAAAHRVNPPGAGRIGARGGRGVAGPAGRIASPRMPAASAQPAGSGRPRPAAFAASARWLPGQTAGRRAQAASAPDARPFGQARAACRVQAASALAVQPFGQASAAGRVQAASAPAARPFGQARTAGRVQAASAPAAQPFGQARAAGRDAPRDSRPAWAAAAAPVAAPAAASPARRAAEARMRASPRDLWRRTPGEAGPSLPWPQRAPATNDAFDAPHPPAARRPPGEQAWRASGHAATATRSARAAPGERVPAGPGALPRQARAQAAQTPPWPQRGQGVAHAFDAPRAPARRWAPGEQAWRAREPAATAARFPPQGAAARTAAGIAIGRSVDLVWPAAAASAAAPGAVPRVGSAPALGGAPAPSMPAAAMPAPSGRSGKDSAVCATALDPVLANRLADEVIRRIDYRARIERERRGL
jgi:hypothetical protein